MRLAAGARVGHHEIRSVLAAGGMGVVYRAYDSRLLRDVAIKQVLAGGASGRELLREARTASALSHPNVCTIHEVIDAGDESFIVMELVDGRTLGDLIQPGGLGEAAVLDFGGQIADAVAHAHARRIVHRDLKSANVMVTPDGCAKVLDFGLAIRAVETAIDAATETRHDANVAGTLAYMAPELLKGSPADSRTDVWALGVVLYEMATGHRPFRGQTGFELAHAIFEHPVAPPDGVSSGLSAVIQRCLSRQPGQRYQSAAELRAALKTVADLERPVTASPRRGWRRVALAAGAVLAAVALALALLWWRQGTAPRAGDVRALAVLPFADVTKQEPVLADGMTDALISDLTKLPTLRVISRTSVMRYRTAPKPLGEVARELGVDAIVDGSVLRDGARVRVTVALVDPRTQQQRWSDQYERESTDLFSLQREIARSIAVELRGRLTSSVVMSGTGAVGPEAHEAYMRGRYHWNRRTEHEVKQSVEYFSRAVALDPQFAEAHVGLSEAYNVLGFYAWLPPAEVFPKGRAAAERALSLQPNLADAHASLAYVRLYYDWDWAAAEAAFQRALQINAGSALVHQWYANYLTSRGRFDAALTEMQRAIELDPLSSIMSAARGWILWYARRYPEALAALNASLAIDPEFLQSHLWRALIHEQLEQWPAAEAAAENAIRISNRSPSAVTALARIAARTGRRVEAQRLVNELTARAQPTYVSRYDLALIHLALDDRARALDLLEESLERRENPLVFARWDARLDRVRADPRFKAIVDRVDRRSGPS
jgi:serine/threonine-protein kinase